ncbi:MAG: hypothetical protein EA001_14285 [Oscillatoriales cyanobacterium]|nr:MAG: hypothetical protein EA001_14285 [Oscillatoriales cyanobacterium]
MSDEDFLEDFKIQDATIRTLEIPGEATKRCMKATAIDSRLPGVGFSI